MICEVGSLSAPGSIPPFSSEFGGIAAAATLMIGGLNLYRLDGSAINYEVVWLAIR